jgi:hypothetical protein
MSKNVNGQELLLGRAKVYISRYVAGVRSIEEFFLGNVLAFEITPSVEKIEAKDFTTPASPTIASDTIGQSLQLRMQCQQFNLKNLALAFGGQVGALAQSSGGPVSNEAVSDVLQGNFYQLGGTTSPKRNVTSVVVTDVPGTTTFVANTDYEVDAATGRIYIIPGGGIADGTDLHVDYSYTAASNKKVGAGLEPEVLAFVRLVGNNKRGKNAEVQIWRVNLSSTGAVPFIGEEYASFVLEGEIESDAAGHPNDPYFQLIEL